MRRLCLLARIVPCALLVSTSAAARGVDGEPAGGVNVITAWQRTAGLYSDVERPERGKTLAVDPYDHQKALRTNRLYDAQYGRKLWYRGLRLVALIERVALDRAADMIIFQFANGMQIPLQRKELKDSDPFLAVESCDDKGRTCSPSFESVGRRAVYGEGEDPRPISFTWNKVVVSRDKSGFTPWHYVDTLVGLEFVDAHAYQSQFAVGNSGGQQVYFERCQFCHGVRHVGARFGWDFVTPLPLHEKRPPAHLLSHVKFPKALAQRLGIQMPPQPDIDADEVKTLWLWMKDVAAKPLKPYAP